MKSECIESTYNCENCVEKYLLWRFPEERRVLNCSECGGRCFDEMGESRSEKVITINIHPCLKFKDVSWSEQYIKTFSEMGELAKELLDRDRTKAGYEAMDAITTLVNLMYNQLGFTEEEIGDIARLTNEKNRIRGYLDGD